MATKVPLNETNDEAIEDGKHLHFVAVFGSLQNF